MTAAALVVPAAQGSQMFRLTYDGKVVRQNAYAVQGDNLLRWTISGTAWKSKVSLPGSVR
jgi:hypothetical protein